MSDLLKLEHVLGEASSFTHAIFLAAAGLGDSQNTNAIQMVAGELAKSIEKARCIIDDLRSKPLTPSVVDLKALEKAVRAEIARRKSLKVKEGANG